MDEFKLQFSPARLVSGARRINEGYREKHYVAAFVQGNRIVHESRIWHKRNLDAVDYSNKVLVRYRSMAQAALLSFVESQHVEPTN